MSVLPSCWVVGAGGHGKIVIDALRSNGTNVLGVLDDNMALVGQDLNDAKVQGPISSAIKKVRTGEYCHLAIGGNKVRKELASRFSASEWLTAVHARAWVSGAATVGLGSLIGANAVVQCDAVIGEHTIVNTAAVVEHDVMVGPFAHIAPGATLGGGAAVGEGTLVGTGAIVLPGVRIGRWCQVGAGAVVTRDVSDSETVVGVPAVVLRAKR